LIHDLDAELERELGLAIVVRPKVRDLQDTLLRPCLTAR